MSERNQLKRATEKLVKSLGGIEPAASIIGKGKSTVGRWTCKNEADSVNLLDLYELEANADDPLVTKALARLHGGVFVPGLAVPGDSDSLASRVMDLFKELGELADEVRKNGGRDFDPAKALDELHDVEVCVASLKLALAALDGKPALRVAS